MKRSLFLLLAGLIAVVTVPAFACQTSKVSLELTEEKTSNVGGVKLYFIAVTEDSRCAPDVECVWAGLAKVKVKATLNGESKEMEFSTDKQDVGQVIGGYEVKLVNLSPSRLREGLTVKGLDYTATFSVSKAPKAKRAKK